MSSAPVLLLADCDAWMPDSFDDALSLSERQRAGRFARAADRRRFVVRRGLLRRLLGEWLGCAPDRVPLRIGPHGKPVLGAFGEDVTSARRPGVLPAFNLSRSDGLVLFAVTAPPVRAAAGDPGGLVEASIGVDLERIDHDRRTGNDLLRVAEHFAVEETRLLRGLPPEEATRVFYRFWTCKEACLKCLGTGIGGENGPTLAEVALAIDADGDVRAARWDRGDMSWEIRCLEPCASHAAAVAVPAGQGGGFDAAAVGILRLDPPGAG